MIDVTQQRELIKQAVDGDTQALEQLLLANCDAVAAHIRPKLAGPLQSLVSVEDILQETFFRAFQQIGKFKPKSDHSFQAWLKTIAENRILDTIKHQKRKKRGGEMQRVNLADAMFTTIGDLVDTLADLNGSARPRHLLPYFVPRLACSIFEQFFNRCARAM